MFKSKFGKIKIAIVELIFEKTQSKFEIQCIGRSTKSWGTPPLCDFVHAIFGLSAHRFWIQLVVPSQALSTNTFQCFCCISQKLLGWSVQKNWIEQQKYTKPKYGFQSLSKVSSKLWIWTSKFEDWNLKIWSLEHAISMSKVWIKFWTKIRSFEVQSLKVWMVKMLATFVCWTIVFSLAVSLQKCWVQPVPSQFQVTQHFDFQKWSDQLRDFGLNWDLPNLGVERPKL